MNVQGLPSVVNCLTVVAAGLLSALGHADPECLARSTFVEMVDGLSLARGIPRSPTRS